MKFESKIFQAWSYKKLAGFYFLFFQNQLKDQRLTERMRDLSLVELEDEEIPEPESAQFHLEILNEVHEDSAVKNDDNDDG